MQKKVTHNRLEETIEAKSRWFQSLSLEERAELFISFTDMILEINPKIVEQSIAQPVVGRIRIVSKP